MASTKVRLFLGFGLSNNVCGQLIQLQQYIQQHWHTTQRHFKPLAAIHPGNLHLTLRFLGQVEQEKVVSLCNRIEQLQKPRFSLPMSKVEHWPTANLICLTGIKSAELDIMHQTLQQLIEPLKFFQPTQPFRPHISLIRNVKDLAKGLSNDGFPMTLAQPITFTPDMLTLYQSSGENLSIKPCYQALASWPLGKQIIN
ncbi:RNA 2',3'-cyclic phosphodiesterase [Shewanella maritima]|uniref:RNA 2',3'-cyclic phosphodiesterase n=1 Tax=Shewanella maritima TaxID=2520507 RepID=UPI0037366C1C